MPVLVKSAAVALAAALSVPGAMSYCNFETCLLEFDYMDWDGDDHLNVEEVQYTICANVTPEDFEYYDVDGDGLLDIIEWGFVCSDYYEYGRLMTPKSRSQ
jgi:hypothetical protein